MWKNRCMSIPEEDRPETICETRDLIGANFMPNIYATLQIFATLPASTASAERPFSVLKPFKILFTKYDDRGTNFIIGAYVHTL